ncbi:MAG TPA: hypothetical protein VM489_02335 [Burkholderiales bacterium]|nr:hypothetical protein [Burkholderiales bacterium]
MPRRKKPAVSREEPVERIVKRPDGYYLEKRSGELSGPYQTRAEAEADRLAGGAAEDEFGAGASLQEAESELGVSDWIDPDTGGPAEDGIPRLEDH